jgi:AraC-like DNA-binding protein
MAAAHHATEGRTSMTTAKSNGTGVRGQSNNRAFGEHLADCFDVPQHSSHIERTLQRGPLAMSELKVDVPSAEPSASLGYDEAFLVGVQLINVSDHEYWVNGRTPPVEPVVAGMTYVHDLRHDPRALVRVPTHAFHFYMPLATLNAFAEQNEIPLISELTYQPMVGRDDPVMRALSQAALAALREKHATTGLLLDGILSAACAHALGAYGNARVPVRRPPSGLARWQERRAKELMNERMDVSLSELALECGLSVTHFSRAFRQSTGTSPHQWLLAHRISKAKSLLSGSKLSLAEIALACGFSSQSHFNAAFRSSTNVSPGRWRRSFAADG